MLEAFLKVYFYWRYLLLKNHFFAKSALEKLLFNSLFSKLQEMDVSFEKLKNPTNNVFFSFAHLFFPLFVYHAFVLILRARSILSIKSLIPFWKCFFFKFQLVYIKVGNVTEKTFFENWDCAHFWESSKGFLVHRFRALSPSVLFTLIDWQNFFCRALKICLKRKEN